MLQDWSHSPNKVAQRKQESRCMHTACRGQLGPLEGRVVSGEIVTVVYMLYL